MDTIESIQTMDKYSHMKLSERLSQLRKESPEKIFDIETIKQYGMSCPNNHQEAGIFEIGIHIYQGFAGLRSNIGTVSDSKMKVCVCSSCYKDIYSK